MSPCVKMAPDGSSAVRAVIRHGVSGAAVSISAPSKCGTRLSNVSVPSSDDAIAPACAESRSSRSRVASPSPAFDNANRNGWRLSCMRKLPSPRRLPPSERTSPLNFNPSSPISEPLAASCNVMRPDRSSRSIANAPKLNSPFDGAMTRPWLSRPTSSARPSSASCVARHTPRNSEPRLNSTSCLSARSRVGSFGAATESLCSRRIGAGSSRASSAPSTRTGAPTSREASASNCGLYLFQSTNSGAASAATSAMMAAIANPSSVVCNGYPRGKRRGSFPPHLSRHHKEKCGEVTTPQKDSQRRNDLPGVENALRIERRLHGPHRLDRLGAEHRNKVFLLALPNAVLAGAGAVHPVRPLGQPMDEFVPALHLVCIIDVAQHQTKKIPVADMAHDWLDQLEPLDVMLGLGHAIGEARDRHADIGGHRPRAGTNRRRCPIGIMARLPQPRAVLRARRPLKCPTPAILGDLRERRRLLGDLRFAAVKLQQQQRCLRQRQL